VVPAVTSSVTPVILPARSDARKTAALAMSFIMGNSFSMVSFLSRAKNSFPSSPPCAAASRKGRESGEPADRMLTTRTPCDPSSAARFLENASIAQQAGPNPPTIG
jgi:hypothetical protein